ncbi:Glutamine cyclotransferase protein [Salinisphaera shabanensis E1L3A]|uniref:Glutamine cyclotransferase protein n=1 Tax=Salinisphaera shabanensis E1L3A TaxID=1033802 RepID=U2E9B8_9GAMM|nr:glutaminyl-peptide cyclotransferase [Salinisphaera shabanensis]ERJ20291.1 Glutamine cyclotransferase protein [Salinisphaera shabanensis E1L3A]
MPRFFLLLAVILTALLSTACPAQTAATNTARIAAQLPHDASAFTQGLLFYDGALFESTGKYGHSRLRRVNPDTGAIDRQISLPRRYFGEGLARVDDRLFWLTWRAGRAFVLDANTFEQLGTRRYDGEGWGLTYDGHHLIMSDGSATLRVLDPADFTVVRRIDVHDHDRAVDKLNELEYIDGEIWANIWYSDRIARIDPDSGDVVAWLDARALRDAVAGSDDINVLNGIAWDAEAERVYLTGKYWPTLFIIERPGREASTGEAR